MVRIHAPTRSKISGPVQQQEISIARPNQIAVRRRLRISPFWQHFLEMFAAMWIGMAAGKPIFLAITGLSATSQAYRLYPVQSVSWMALSMTLPMVAWMVLRGHGWRNSAEMATAMLVPAIPFIILCSLHVLAGGTGAGVYMVLSTLAMLGLMFYRRDVYSMRMRPVWLRRGRRLALRSAGVVPFTDAR